jgi:hypothetical protein
VTDAQITSAIAKLSTEERLALASAMKTTERNIYRWQRKPPTQNARVRAALEKALGGKR